MKALVKEALALLAIAGVILLQLQQQARADFLTNHAGGHGPLAATGSTPTWGTVDLCCSSTQRWIGDVDGAYWALPTGGNVWIVKSSAPNTVATAWEFSAPPWGRSYTVTSTWKNIGWAPQLVTIQYDDACPITPGMNTLHVCSGDWTPFDNAGVPTVVIGNGIPKPGLPYGDYLKDTGGGGPGSWCTANLSDYPAITPPGGLPNHVVAVDACP